jgi:aldehyde dehydrogenase (NAD+)
MTATIFESGRLRDSGLLIGDEWLEKGSGGTFDHRYPGTGQIQAQVALAGVDEIDAAVTAAKAALPAWRAMRADVRRDLLARLAVTIEEHAEEFASLTIRENGTPAATAAWNPAMSRDWFAYYAGWADKIEGSTIPTFPVEGFSYTRAEPYGVVGIITTWNGPLILLGMKVAAALAAGNCVVLKPHELTPFASLRFAQLALEAGLPAGVLNVVPGGPEAGDRLVRHPDVGKVSFTGGPGVAKEIIKASHEVIKPLSLELGGKSANLLFADANLDLAVPFAVNFSIVAATGQGCALGTRLVVEDSIYDEVIERVTSYLGMLKVGDPQQADTIIGPVITEASCNRIVGMIDDAVQTGAGRLVTGGSRIGGDLADGYFVEPTVFADVDVQSTIAQQEVFGPVLCMMKFSDEEEAIRIANATTYGLAALIQSNDLRRVHYLASQLEAGSIWVNGFPMMAPASPFGGYKQSGYGREGGKPGLDEFLQVKNVYVQFPQ